MKKLNSAIVGIDQGVTDLFSDFEDDGPMWSGEGTRERFVKVQFSSAFKSIPAVHASLKMIDIKHDHNYRLDLQVGSISETGFVLLIRTWADTKIARASATWMAIGEMRDESDWEV